MEARISDFPLSITVTLTCSNIILLSIVSNDAKRDTVWHTASYAWAKLMIVGQGVT